MQGSDLTFSQIDEMLEKLDAKERQRRSKQSSLGTSQAVLPLANDLCTPPRKISRRIFYEKSQSTPEKVGEGSGYVSKTLLSSSIDKEDCEKLAQNLVSKLQFQGESGQIVTGQQQQSSSSSSSSASQQSDKENGFLAGKLNFQNLLGEEDNSNGSSDTQVSHHESGSQLVRSPLQDITRDQQSAGKQSISAKKETVYSSGKKKGEELRDFVTPKLIRFAPNTEVEDQNSGKKYAAVQKALWLR